MNRYVTLCIVMLLSLVSVAERPVPRDDFAPGWTLSGRALRFAQENLYDYIDGGAELFLEFGFEELAVYRYARGEEEITLEMYRMESPASALGIYLMRCGEETPVEGIRARNSGDRYQFNVLKGSHFVQVNSFEGDESLVPVMVALTQRALQGVPEGDSVRLFEHLPREGLVRGSELLIRGPYGLQAVFTFGKGDVLKLGGEVFGVVGNYELGDSGAGGCGEEDGRTYSKIFIPYSDAEAARSAYESLVQNLDEHVTVLARSESGFVFRDYRGKFGSAELKGRLLELRVNLPERPVSASEEP
ncbi:MAG: hypothetical protein JSW03_07215 [Candidatus Eiseniibacteriota bacterium]|nr:MAG: hypothetical protein JSW03_07215 [Candidatus Eisenbacteria bacterium]